MKLKTLKKVNHITIPEEGGHTNDKTKIGEIEHCVVMWLCGSGMVAISNSFHERAVWKRRERESLICGSCTKERLELERSHSNAAMMTMDDDNRC